VAVRPADLDAGVVHPRPLAGTGPEPGEQALLSSGPPLAGTSVRVLGDAGPATGTGRPVGRLVVEGPQCSPGYWPLDGPLDGPLEGPLDGPLERSTPLVTGDLGFVLDGEVFVLGRCDEVLILNGRNVHLPDLVDACASVPGLRPGRITAFTVEPPDAAASQLVVVAELGRDERPGPQRRAELEARIRQAVGRALDLVVSRVHLVPAGGLPVTTSGKVRTAEARRLLLGPAEDRGASVEAIAGKVSSSSSQEPSGAVRVSQNAVPPE
jgi:acyl-CoA synthetase (AMP-forming)/AMP-acid ligase II